MKRIYKYISLLALTAGLIACNKVTVETNPDGKYRIAFDEVTTKAVITDENLASFKVWGETTAGAADVFDGVEVTGSAPDGTGKMTAWSYYTDEADAKYWEENKTYKFFAVAPATLEMSYDPTEGYGVEYKISDDMAADPVDMVVASQTRVIGNLESEPDYVQLTFSHTLSKVQVQLTKSSTNAEQNIIVKEVYLYGMKGTGVYHYNSSAWTLGTELATIGREDITSELTTGSYTGFGEFMMIPQSLEQDSVYLIVSFDYTSNGATTSRMQFALIPVDVVDAWVANKSYTYKAEISVDHDMIFELPSIENWISNNEGGTIIIK